MNIITLSLDQTYSIIWILQSLVLNNKQNMTCTHGWKWDPWYFTKYTWQSRMYTNERVSEWVSLWVGETEWNMCSIEVTEKWHTSFLNKKVIQCVQWFIGCDVHFHLTFLLKTATIKPQMYCSQSCFTVNIRLILEKRKLESQKWFLSRMFTTHVKTISMGLVLCNLELTITGFLCPQGMQLSESLWLGWWCLKMN